MSHLFSLAYTQLKYRVTFRFSGNIEERTERFVDINQWLEDWLRGEYHIDMADFPLIIYSFSAEKDAVEFKLRFG